MRLIILALAVSGCAAHNARKARTSQMACIDRRVAEMRVALQVSDELHKIKVAEISCVTDCAALATRDRELTGLLEHEDRVVAQTAVSCSALGVTADDAAARANAAAANSVSCTTNTVGGTTFTNCN